MARLDVSEGALGGSKMAELSRYGRSRPKKIAPYKTNIEYFEILQRIMSHDGPNISS